MAPAMGMSNSPTRITQPSIVARVISRPQSRSSSALWRYKGKWALYLARIVSITMRSETRPFSTMRGGTGAVATPASAHDLQARFSRRVRATKYFAGSMSSISLSS